MRRKIIGILVCMLLVGTILPVTGTVIIDKTTSSNISGNTLCVGGSGEGNYTRIQDAINDAVDGDTVFVYDDSSPYKELLIIDKSINLIGEDRDTTVIDGQPPYNSDVICILADFVTIQGFTIKGGYNSGIVSLSHNNTIKGNTIIDNGINGIQLGINNSYNSNDNIIEGNKIIENDGFAVFLGGSSNNNIISNNIISSNKWHGIYLRGINNNNNLITYNTISSNGEIGVWLLGANFNIIQHNNIVNNKEGVIIIDSNNNQVLENNIYNNKYMDAEIDGTLSDLLKDNWLKNNIFDSNYWGRARYLPRPIFVACLIFIFNIWLITFDWHPAQEPYDI